MQVDAKCSITTTEIATKMEQKPASLLADTTPLIRAALGGDIDTL